MDAPHRRCHCFDVPQARDRAYGAILGAALGAAAGGAAAPGVDGAVLGMRTMAAYFRGAAADPGPDLAARLLAAASGGGAAGAPQAPDPVTAAAMARPGFAAAPAEAARLAAGPAAENGALLRAVACAFTAAPSAWATLLTEATHADERCAAAAVTLAALLNALARIPPGAPVPATVVVLPVTAGRGLLGGPRSRDFSRRLAASRDPPDLDLGGARPGYVLRALACAAWAVRQLVKTPAAERGPAFFAAAVGRVAAQGGDAGVNCAVVGAVLGAALGEGALPGDWLAALPCAGWLADEVADFLAAALPTWAILGAD